MQLLNKARTLRTLGGVVAALAIVPWIGVGAAQATGGGDDDCGTRPAGVSGDATCNLLLGPNGTKVFGETWAVRTSDNHLVVWTFPDMATGSVELCVRSSGAYPAKHQCNGTDSDNAWSGSSTTIDLPLKSAGIAGDEKAYWALGVEQGSSVAVSLGSQGAIPGWSPSPTPSSTPTTTPTHTPTHTPRPSHTPTTTPSGTTTPSPSPSHTHTHSPSPSPSPSHTHTHTPSPSPSTTTTTTTPTPSVSPSSTHTDGTSPSPSTSVLGTKLAHTGSDDVTGALVLSIGLLALGGILVVSSQTVPAAARRRH
jgi:hypothetical protein